MLFIPIRNQSLFSENLWDSAEVVHVYDFWLATAGRVGERDKATSPIAMTERWHLARIGHGRRDARAP